MGSMDVNNFPVGSALPLTNRDVFRFILYALWNPRILPRNRWVLSPNAQVTQQASVQSMWHNSTRSCACRGITSGVHRVQCDLSTEPTSAGAIP